MPLDQVLIQTPVLDNSLEQDRVAARIFRSIGGLTLQDILLEINALQSLAAMVGNNYLIAVNATSFTLSFGDPAAASQPTTASILQAGLTAAIIQTNLQGLSTVGAGGVTVVDNGDGTFTANFSTSLPLNYVLNGVGTGGAAVVTITPQPSSVPNPLLSELTSARPAEPHVVMLTEFERMWTEALFELNIVPNQNKIEMLRLLGTIPNPAKPATCILQFTKDPLFIGTDITIPAGTPVSTQDFQTRVATDADLDLPIGQQTGTVSATSLIVGNIGVIPINSLTQPNVSIAGILSQTNTTPLSGGRDGESIVQASIRARELLDTGRSLGSINDWQNKVYFDVLARLGRVTSFEGYRSDFSQAPGLGYLLLVVQDQTGLFPAQNILNGVAFLISTRKVAGLQCSVTGPTFLSFSITADVQVSAGVSATSLLAKAKAQLQAAFNPLTFPLAPERDNADNIITRYITLGRIIAEIGSAGTGSIQVKFDGDDPRITITVGTTVYDQDVPLSVGMLPLLTGGSDGSGITLNVVN
jgi:hypothetical protein